MPKFDLIAAIIKKQRQFLLCIILKSTATKKKKSRAIARRFQTQTARYNYNIK